MSAERATRQPSAASQAFSAALREWLGEKHALQARIFELEQALKPFAAIAAPRHPIEEPDGPSAIDLMTCNGEYDELGMTSYTGAGPGAVILDGDWFREARAALSAPAGDRS